MIMTFKNDSPLSIVLSFLKDLDSCFSTNLYRENEIHV